MAAILKSTNRSKSGYVIEATNGVTPASPAWKEQRLTSMGLKLDPKRGRSNEVRSDGQAPGTFLLDLENSGPIGGEISFRTHDDHYQSTLKGVWANTPERDNNGTADSVITDVATTNTEVTHTTGAAFVASQLVLFSGFGVAGNNGLFKCTTGGATTSRYVGSGITDESAPPAAARMKVVGFVGASGDITATTVGGNALLSTTLDFTTVLPASPVGRWLYVGGAAAGEKFATAANKGWARISAVTANRISFDVVPAGWSTDNGSGKTVQVFVGDFLKNGVTLYSYSWERQQQDLASPAYEYFRGNMINKMTLAAQGGKEFTVSYDFVGIDGDAMGTARFASSTDIAVNTYAIMTSYRNTLQLAEGGVSLLNGVNCLSSSSIEVTNNITREQVEGGIALNIGELMASAKFDGYLGDHTIMAKSANDTASSMFRVMGYRDGNREAYVWDLPYGKYTLTSDVPGKNQGRKVTGTFEAEPHPTLGYTISLSRHWYLPA